MSASRVKLRRAPHAPIGRPAIHPMTCRCHRCDPFDAFHVHHANRLARLTIAGLALGIAVAWASDLLIGGPGVLVIFGVST